MRHLVIGQRQKAPNFSAFHWLPQGCLITIGQHFVITRVVHLPKRTKTSLITESDQSRANHTVRTAWSDLDQAVWAMHSCKSWFTMEILLKFVTSFFQGRSTFNSYFRFNTHKHCIMLVTVLESGLETDCGPFWNFKLDIPSVKITAAGAYQHSSLES